MKNAGRSVVILGTVAIALALGAGGTRSATTSYSFTGDWSGTAVVASAQGMTVMLSAAFTDTGAKTFDGTFAVQANPAISCMAHGRRGGKHVSVKVTACSNGSTSKASGKLDPATDTITGTFRTRNGKHRSRGTFTLTKVPPTTTTETSTSTTTTTT